MATRAPTMLLCFALLTACGAEQDDSARVREAIRGTVAPSKAATAKVDVLAIEQKYRDHLRSANDLGDRYVVLARLSGEHEAYEARLKVFIADGDGHVLVEPVGEPKPVPVQGPAAPPGVVKPLRSIASEPGSALSGWAVPVGSEVDRGTGFPMRVRRIKDQAEMVLIPSGTFEMGATPGDGEAEENEAPRHPVTISTPYYLDVNEVTIAQWRRFVSDGNGRWPRDLSRDANEKKPIYYIYHTDAVAYATWVGGMLPTEAQWERAARGGRSDSVFPWGPKDDPALRHGDEGYKQYGALREVRSFKPNDYGLFDIAGNACEWCADWLGQYEASPVTDPLGPPSGVERVVRGTGAGRRDYRVSVRIGYRPNGVSNADLSFRVARSL
jgi:sulfatase modifying factor 1